MNLSLRTLAMALALTCLVSAQVIDIVGDTSNSSTGSNLAKGNSYQVLVDVDLFSFDAWLTFSTTESVVFSVYSSPVEFGTYTQVWTNPQTVTGTGAAFYNSGAIGLRMVTGMHYILVTSWTGSVGYNFDTGPDQPTFFGAHTHGYAVGRHPLGTTLSSTSNDSAIYYQRVTTIPTVPPQWELNDAAASMDVDGIQLLNPYGTTPAQTRGITSSSSTLNVASNVAGTAQEIVYNLAPLISRANGALATGGGQLLNVNLGAPSTGFVFGGAVPSFAPFAGNYSVPITSSVAFTLAGQAVLLDPASADGFSFTQGIEHTFSDCPTSEDFEGLALGTGSFTPGWSNPVGASRAWTVHTAGTGSTGTGPTSASGGSNYIYCETSGATGAVFEFATCDIGIGQVPNFTVDFSLSRIGATIGTLELFQDDGTGTFGTLLQTWSGNDVLQAQGGIEWSAESVPFIPTSATVAFLFRYTAGTSFTGDIAIDDLVIR